MLVHCLVCLQMFSIETIEKIMDETKEAVEYQQVCCSVTL